MAESPQLENNILPPWGCSICFEESREPVCTTCGHLFCWPCLYTWVHDMAKQACPVCRAPLSVDTNVVPVYVAPRAEPSQDAAAPTNATPPRPHAASRRSAPSARAQSNITSAETQVRRDNSNRVHLHRETVLRMQHAQATERQSFAVEEAVNLQYQEADNQSLLRLRQELNGLQRRNAAMPAERQASSNNSQMDQLRRSRNEDLRRRVMSTIIGSRFGPR